MKHTQPRGFTLVELVMIMIVVGLLAVAAIPRLFGRQTFDTRAYFDQVQAILRYGQKVAIGENRNIHVSLDGSRVALCYDAACSSPVRPASGTNSGSSTTKLACKIGGAYQSVWSCEAPPQGVTVSAGSSFYFSPLGKPYRTADVPPSSSFSGMVVTIGGDVTRTITVERETGYVH